MATESIKKHAQNITKFATDYEKSMDALRNMDVITAFRTEATKTLTLLATRAKRLGVPFKLNVEQAVEDMVHTKFPSSKGELGMVFDPPLSKFNLNETTIGSYLNGETLRLGYQDLGDHGNHELEYVYRDGTWYGRYAGSHGVINWLAEPPIRSSY